MQITTPFTILILFSVASQNGGLVKSLFLQISISNAVWMRWNPGENMKLPSRDSIAGRKFPEGR